MISLKKRCRSDPFQTRHFKWERGLESSEGTKPTGVRIYTLRFPNGWHQHWATIHPSTDWTRTLWSEGPRGWDTHEATDEDRALGPPGTAGGGSGDHLTNGSRTLGIHSEGSAGPFLRATLSSETQCLEKLHQKYVKTMAGKKYRNPWGRNERLNYRNILKYPEILKIRKLQNPEVSMCTSVCKKTLGKIKNKNKYINIIVFLRRT